jgi:hypothetical protein
VTIVYWAILSSSSTFSTSYSGMLFAFWHIISLIHPPQAWYNISAHALNTPFALFEILFSNTPPAPWITLPCGLLILAAYLGVAYITKADQGFYSAFFPISFSITPSINQTHSTHSIQLPKSTHSTRAPCWVDRWHRRRVLRHFLGGTRDCHGEGEADCSRRARIV